MYIEWELMEPWLTRNASTAGRYIVCACKDKNECRAGDGDPGGPSPRGRDSLITRSRLLACRRVRGGLCVLLVWGYPSLLNTPRTSACFTNRSTKTR